MTTSDLVKEMCQKQGISIAALAKKLGQTRQNFYKKLQRDTLTLTELKQIAEVLDANFEQLFRMPDGKFSLKSENKKRTVLPLVGSAFEPGGAKEAIERIQDKELSEIAQAELYYFSAQAENCVKIVENYLSSEDIMLRLSADMLYTFANLTLGNAKEAQSSREDVYKCLKWVFQEDETNEKKASCVFAFYVISILFTFHRKKIFRLWKNIFHICQLVSVCLRAACLHMRLILEWSMPKRRESFSLRC